MRPFTRSQTLRSLQHIRFHPARRRVDVTRHLIRPLHSTRTGRQQADQAEPFEQVKVSRRVFNWRRLALIAAYGGGSYILFNLFIGHLFDRLGVDVEALEEEEEAAGEEDESTFIALSYPQKLPQTFYKQSDPEWLEFVKMSRDEARKAAVREELAQRVTQDISAHPRMQMRLGNDINLTKYWLELKFPDSPPADYARKVIEWGPEYIAVGTQVIPHSQYAQLHHVLVSVPQAVGTATFNSVRIWFLIHYAKLKKALGFNLTTFDRQVQTLSLLEQPRLLAALKETQESMKTTRTGDPMGHLHEHMKRNLNIDPRRTRQQQRDSGPASNGSVVDSKVDKPTPSSDKPVPPSDKPTPLTDNPALATATAVPTSPTYPQPSSDLLTIMTDISITFRTFLSTLMNALLSARTEAEPRGAFLVVGQVEVAGDRGRVKCDVKAAYDPKIAKYLYVRTTVKHFWELEQVAKGGP